jgi:hypothetical protein
MTHTNNVTIIGSTKHFEEAMECNRYLTSRCYFVYACGHWGHSYHKDVPTLHDPQMYEVIKTLHLLKILCSDFVVLVDDRKPPNLGHSTQIEYDLCERLGIPVYKFTGEGLTPVLFGGKNWQGLSYGQALEYLRKHPVTV